ncbi:MAG: RNA methyltransferase [Bacteroidales bacterium]|nr:RNA methyltransferase [Bacteroidales bacterium]
MEYSKNTAKFIRSLKDKKMREESGLFVVEGEKMVEEALRSGWEVEAVFATAQAAANLTKGVLAEVSSGASLLQTVSPAEMEKISLLSSPSPALALVRKPRIPEDLSALVGSRPLALGLDGVRDPGNLGTILRLSDWFGIDVVFASDELCRYPTSDVYNPKVVQATMGAIFRKKVIYTDLKKVASAFVSEGLPVYGTFLDGEEIYSQPLKGEGLIVMGNESEGISPELAALVSHRLFIPPYPAGAQTSESLNVATATAITLSEFRRRVL